MKTVTSNSTISPLMKLVERGKQSSEKRDNTYIVYAWCSIAFLSAFILIFEDGPGNIPSRPKRIHILCACIPHCAWETRIPFCLKCICLNMWYKLDSLFSRSSMNYHDLDNFKGRSRERMKKLNASLQKRNTAIKKMSQHTR